MKSNQEWKQWGKLIMRGLTCERSWLAQRLEEIGFRKVELRTFEGRTNQSWHDFVWGEKGTVYSDKFEYD
jgi:hypothetical protein